MNNATNNAPKPIIIGVAGGTASGKTTVSQEILKAVGPHRLAYIEHDAYYRDLSHLPLEQRKALNFDHPDSLENELLISHLERLLRGEVVEIRFTNPARKVHDL